VLWDRPDLERLYSRLEGEYELKERADALGRKLSVIAETTKALTDIIDTERSLRLELIIVALHCHCGIRDFVQADQSLKSSTSRRLSLACSDDSSSKGH
jgi:hypothetical protein